MNLKKLGKGLVFISAWYAAVFGLNSLMSNREYISGHYHSVGRADGAFGSTEYIQYHHGDYKHDEVRIFKFPNASFYDDGGIDGPHDGLVDRIHSMILFKDIILERDKHFYSYRAEFEKADKTLAQAKERFQKFFK